jgi:hypothetical protein
MKKLISVLFVCLLSIMIVAGVVFGADAVVPVVATAAASTTLLGWFQANSVAVLTLALVISEFLGLIPAFQGNGILDTIIKALKVLGAKDPLA